MFWSLLGVKGSKRHVLVNSRKNLVIHFFFKFRTSATNDENLVFFVRPLWFSRVA